MSPAFILITPDPIPPQPPLFPQNGENGALCEFWGIVRGEEKGLRVSALQYDSYKPMAYKEIQKIIKTLLKTYPCRNIKVIHRIGIVPVGEASLWISVQGKHRQEAIQFIDQFIIEMKKNVPIWKK